MSIRQTNLANDHKWAAALLTIVFVFPLGAGTILSGGATVRPGQVSFSVSGADFSAQGSSVYLSQYVPCGNPCSAPGTYYQVLGMGDTDQFVQGSYTLDGAYYSFFCGNHEYSTCGAGIDFSSGPLILPDVGSTPPAVLTFTAPFQSVGGIGGLGLGPGVSFNGVGIATLTFNRSSGSMYTFGEASYRFIAVPEPQTLALVGLSLALVCMQGYRVTRGKKGTSMISICQGQSEMPLGGKPGSSGQVSFGVAPQGKGIPAREG